MILLYQTGQPLFGEGLFYKHVCNYLSESVSQSVILCLISSKDGHSQNCKSKGPEILRHHPMAVTCQVSGVKCQVSGDTCQVLLFVEKRKTKKVELVSVGSVIAGAYPV